MALCVFSAITIANDWVIRLPCLLSKFLRFLKILYLPLFAVGIEDARPRLDRYRKYLAITLDHYVNAFSQSFVTVANFLSERFKHLIAEYSFFCRGNIS